MSTAITCPQCQVKLRTQRVLPANRQVRCPKCSTSFSLSESMPLVEVPGRSIRLKWVLLLVACPLLMALGLVGWLTYPSSTSSTLTSSAQESQTHSLPERSPVQQIQQKERQEEKQEEKRRRDRWVKIGAAALARANLTEAEQAYKELLKNDPNDPEAQQGLNAVAQARVQAQEAQQRKTVEDQRAEQNAGNARMRLAQGKKLREAGELLQALTTLEEALRLTPEDPEIRQALAEVRLALEAREQDNRRRREYRAHLDAGRAALAVERYTEALREFTLALERLPNDPDALAGRRQAENGLKLARAQPVQPAPAPKDPPRVPVPVARPKRGLIVEDLLTQARLALSVRRYQEALAHYESAILLAPEDPTVRLEWLTAQQTFEQAKREYNRLLNRGELAARGKRFTEAAQLYAEATQVWPEGQRVVQLLARLAEQRSSEIRRLLSEAQMQQRAGNFEQAIRLLELAQRLFPDDPQIRDALIRIRSERPAVYAKHMAAGQAALAARRYGDAIREFTTAEAVAPTPAEANAAANLRRQAENAQRGPRRP